MAVPKHDRSRSARSEAPGPAAPAGSSPAAPGEGALASEDSGGNKRLVRIGDLARQLGLTTRALRYWEERHLLPAASRSRGGMRTYGAEHMQAARGVMRLKSAGFSLDEICAVQQQLRGRRTALDGMQAVAVALADREERIRARIREEQALLAELEQARKTVGLCDGCHGKTYDSACIVCLEDRSHNSLPSCLRSVLQAATEQIGPATKARGPGKEGS